MDKFKNRRSVLQVEPENQEITMSIKDVATVEEYPFTSNGNDISKIEDFKETDYHNNSLLSSIVNIERLTALKEKSKELKIPSFTNKFNQNKNQNSSKKSLSNNNSVKEFESDSSQEDFQIMQVDPYEDSYKISETFEKEEKSNLKESETNFS